jgi:hypothetical protein
VISIRDLGRHVAGLMFWAAFVVLNLWALVLVGTSNYLGCKSAFELLGFETQPLWRDPLVGPFLGAFFGEVTLAQCYALGIALVMSLAWFLVAHTGIELHQLWEHRRTHKASGDDAEVRAATQLLVLHSAILAVVLAGLAYAARWEIDLFRYRAVAAALGIDDPKEATAAISRWSTEIGANGEIGAWDLARRGVWGYLAITALCSMCLEVGFYKLAEAWTKLIDPVDRILEKWWQSNVGPEEEAVMPAGALPSSRIEAVGSTTEDTPLVDTDLSTPTPDPTIAAAVPSALALGLGGRVAAAELGRHQVLDDTAAPGGATGGIPGTHHAAKEVRDVIGGTPGERVTLAIALKDVDRFVVSEDGTQIWNRVFWEGLHGQPVPQIGDLDHAA